MKEIITDYIIRIYLLTGCLLFATYASAQPCNDTAGIITLSNPKQFYLQDQITTRSGFRIYSGWIYQGSDTLALLLCHNVRGEVEWVKSYKNDALPRSSFFKVRELRDGNFIVSGKTMDPDGLLEYLLIAKFDAAGNFLWHRLYKPGTFAYTIGQMVPLQMTEDDLGTLYFSFYSASYNFSAVARLDANGNMLWNRSFRHGNATIPDFAIAFMPVIVKNDTLYLAGIGNRDQFTMKLNRNTGELQSVKRFFLGAPLPAATFERQYVIRVFHMSNGHYISVARVHYGLPHQYFFVEWDEHLRFVKAFTLDNPNLIPWTIIFSFFVMPDGTIVAATPYAKNPVNSNLDKIYIALLNTGQQQVFQKKVMLRRNDYRLDRFNDNCLVGADQSGRLMLTPVFSEPGRTAIDIYKFNPDRFQQDCILHEDTVFTGTSHQTMQELSFSFEEIATDVLEEIHAVATVSNEAFIKQVVCEKTSVCDVLSIKGPAQVCAGNAPAVLTASKDERCMRKVNWHIDNAAADSVKQINDSTIHLFFSKEWQGQIRASLEGCSLADTFDLQAKKAIPIQLSAENPVKLCIGQNDTLSPGKDFLSYLWQDGTNEENMAVRSPGIYWVKVTDRHGCESADTVTVTALNDRPGDFIVTDTVVCLYNSIVLQPEGNFIAWRWSTGDTTSSLKVAQQGIYTITVTDRNNCTGIEQVAVTAKPCANHIFFPNAISPNGDGKNDSFKPVITGNLLSYRMQIYNRWGRKIFESTNAALGWNGRTGSVLAATDIYVWQAVVEFAGESRRVLKGTIVLIP